MFVESVFKHVTDTNNMYLDSAKFGTRLVMTDTVSVMSSSSTDDRLDDV